MHHVAIAIRTIHRRKVLRHAVAFIDLIYVMLADETYSLDTAHAVAVWRPDQAPRRIRRYIWLRGSGSKVY